jgi:DNA-directed RNA polymerase sigma subunit (sigma70/sigma32)
VDRIGSTSDVIENKQIGRQKPRGMQDSRLGEPGVESRSADQLLNRFGSLAGVLLVRLTGELPVTLREFGRGLHVTREWVRKIELKAVCKLRD